MPASRLKHAYRVLVVLGLVLSLAVLSLAPGANGVSAKQASIGATLTVLVEPVEVAPVGGTFAAALDGQVVQPGNQVRTGPGGFALLTFFDGSETQLAGETQVALLPPAQGAGSAVSLFQAIGTTVNRVRQGQSATPFQTETPTAVATVRGTTYVLTVMNVVSPARPVSPPEIPPGVSFPRVVEGASDFLLAQAVYEDGGELWEVRTWQDPAGGTYDTFQLLGQAYPQLEEVLYVEDGALVRKRTFQDPTTGETWDTFENLGRPAEEGGAGLPQFAAARAAAPLGQETVKVCRPTGSATHPFVFLSVDRAGVRPTDLLGVASAADCPIESLTSAVLLADPDGHVGQVQLAPRSAVPPIELTQAGDAGAVSSQAAAKGRLGARELQALGQSTQDLRDVAAGQQTEGRAGAIARQFAAAVNFSLPPDPIGASPADVQVSEVVALRPGPEPPPIGQPPPVEEQPPGQELPTPTPRPTSTPTPTPRPPAGHPPPAPPPYYYYGSVGMSSGLAQELSLRSTETAGAVTWAGTFFAVVSIAAASVRRRRTPGDDE